MFFKEKKEKNPEELANERLRKILMLMTGVSEKNKRASNPKALYHLFCAFMGTIALIAWILFLDWMGKQ